MALKNRKKAKKDLEKRVKESHERKDMGGTGQGIFSSEAPFQKWKCSEDDHELDFIPWEIEEEPNVPKYNGLKEGEVAHCIDVYVHQSVGPNNDRYICPQRNYGLPCPICEERDELLDEGYDYQHPKVKATGASRRCIYNVWVHDSLKEQKVGPQVWEVAHWFIEKHISSLARNAKRGTYVPFADPDEGKTFSFTKSGKQRNTEYTGLKFVDRDEPIPDEIVDSAYAIEKYLYLPTYEEMKESFEAGKVQQEKKEGTEPEPDKEEKPEPKEEPKQEEKEEEENEITKEDVEALKTKAKAKKFVKEHKDEIDLDADDIKEMSLEDIKEYILSELGLEEDEEERRDEKKEEEKEEDGDDPEDFFSDDDDEAF